MKKIIVALLALLLVLGSASIDSPSTAQASTNTTEIEGKLTNGRLLVPVRELSVNLGATVVWNAAERKVTIMDNGQKIDVFINSIEVGINDIGYEIDVAAKIYNNVTYVPISFITKILGGTVKWDNSLKQATVTYNQRTLLINGAVDASVKIPNPPSTKRIAELMKKVDEATFISKYAQKRQHLQTYFTESLISNVIQNNGLVLSASEGNYSYLFEEPAYLLYNKQYPFQAILIQSSEGDTDSGYYPNFLYRNVTLIYVDGQWKVNRILTQLTEPRP